MNKYYIYSYLWKFDGESEWKSGAKVTYASITDIYMRKEKGVKRCVNSITEINRTEFDNFIAMSPKMMEDT